MVKVGFYSLLLILGLVLSQLLPNAVGPTYAYLKPFLHTLTMTALAFIMIQVGYDFDIDKRRMGHYAWDYVVAMTAAALPWLLCAVYFVFVMAPPEFWTNFYFWKESLLVSRFASPTSAGVLFSMLAAAGLATTWVYRKARVLAIFDDLDTILLLIPLQMLMVGARWQLGVLAVIIVVLLWVAWRYLHTLNLPHTWRHVLGYALALAVVCEGVYHASHWWDPLTPLHLEVLLPAFVLGCVMARPRSHAGAAEHADDPIEQRVTTLVSGVFMLLAGMSMPLINTDPAAVAAPMIAPTEYTGVSPEALAARDAFPGWGLLTLHIIALWTLSNLGKMFPVFCYRQMATWHERLALGVSMFPRGEVGTGVLVISTLYGVAAPILTAATLTLCVNLICTGLFIVVVKMLLRDVPPPNTTVPPGLTSDLAFAVQDRLRGHIGPSAGLDYAVFLPRVCTDALGVVQVREDDPFAVNLRLNENLENLGLDHASKQQVSLWQQVLPEIHRSFLNLQKHYPVTDGQASPTLSRLVLDVEVGGLLLAVVGECGWIFAATLDQHAMNSGQAERELIEIVQDVGELLTPRHEFPPLPQKDPLP